jgi:hypothetical protein
MLSWMAPLLMSLLTLLPAQYIADLDVTPIAFDAGAFRDAFNAAADRPRLVVVFSPT